MKTIKSILVSSLLLVGALSSLPSCDTLDQPYWMGYYAKKTFSSPGEARAAAVGMYNLMQHPEFLGGRAQIYVDVRGMDVNPVTYFGPVSSMDGTMSSANSVVEYAWEGAYRTLYEINLFIEKLTASTGLLPEDEASLFLNEARFLRGVTYFYILNLWGDQYTKDGTGAGVPWIDRSYDGVSGFSKEAIVARSTVSQIYTRIIEDLTAGTLLPASRGGGGASLYFATSRAAWAMLSRVHLYMENYAGVLDAASKVTGYALDPEPVKQTFILNPSESKEVIFWIAHNDSDNPNTNNALGQHYGITRRGDITLSANYISLFDTEKDTRFTTLVAKNKAGAYFTKKYPNGAYNWAPVIRYGEVVLNEAEARAKQAAGVDETAVALVNTIRTRAGVDEVKVGDFADKDALVEFILTERRRELAFEGHGSFDLFRNKKGIAAKRGSALAAEIPYPNNLFALPIPDADIIKGGGIITQNPGY